MSETSDLIDDARTEGSSFADDIDFAASVPWSLDELEHSADLGSVRSACADRGDAYDF